MSKNLKCSQCGAGVTPEATACKYCGSAIAAVQQPVQRPTPPVQQPNPYVGQPVQPQAPNYGYQQQPPIRQSALPLSPINPAWPLKNKYVAGVLAILFGTFGVHRFYLGNAGLGILYILFFWTGIPTIISFFEGIVYFFSNDFNFQVKHRVRLK
ncbi:MAG: NINE protein [Oscillospiraceae bacterium]|jgi:TM2 domain-containing membrane protein YozV|nr:NINE protein [Oscillospiraceae bacterium]